jgi:hypothetical protein
MSQTGAPIDAGPEVGAGSKAPDNQLQAPETCKARHRPNGPDCTDEAMLVAP